MNVGGGTLSASSFAETVGPLTVGSLGSLNLTIGDILTSTGSANFGGTLNLAGNLSEAEHSRPGIEHYLSFSGVAHFGHHANSPHLSFSGGATPLVARSTSPPTCRSSVLNSTGPNTLGNFANQRKLEQFDQVERRHGSQRDRAIGRGRSGHHRFVDDHA